MFCSENLVKDFPFPVDIILVYSAFHTSLLVHYPGREIKGFYTQLFFFSFNVVPIFLYSFLLRDINTKTSVYFFRNNQHHEQQKMVFRRQLNIALEYNKPLVIHCRDAERDCLAILKEVRMHFSFPH